MIDRLGELFFLSGSIAGSTTLNHRGLAGFVNPGRFILLGQHVKKRGSIFHFALRLHILRYRARVRHILR